MADHTLTCTRCGQPFPAERSDARTCSNRCRQKAYRARVAVGPARRRLAYHEAGHAVVTLALGGQVGEMVLRKRGIAHGYTEVSFRPGVRVFRALGGGRYRRQTPEEQHAEARERFDRLHAVTLLAGGATERLLDGGSADPHDWAWLSFPGGGDEGDMERVNAIALRLHPNDPVAFVDRSYGRAFRILIRRWPAVERIAEALLERRRLGGPEVVALANSRNARARAGG